MQSFVNIPTPSQFRIGELFHNNNFTVPLYQRNYAWESTEIEDFWKDLQDLVTDKRNSHFFGQIVTYNNEDGIQEIIDGQQRLTTSSIFMATIRDIAMKLYNDNFKDGNDLDLGDDLRDIRRQVNKSIRGENGELASLTVQQNKENSKQDIQSFFFSLTHGRISVSNTDHHSEPMNNMQHAYNDITQWINNYLKQFTTISDRIEQLQRIFESFYNKFYIVMISAPSRKDAFTIFETLNSRGKDLKASDIIKNHVLSLMSDNIEEGNKSWTAITSKLDNSSDRITRFIRTYWASKKKIVPESRLYREISDNINNRIDAEAFLNDLDQLVNLYTVLESPLAPKYHTTFFDNSEITHGIDILSRMSVKLYYPVVMSMYFKGYSEDDILKVLFKLTSVFVRYRTINGNGTNKLETGFSEIAHKIWVFSLKSVNDINNEINDKLLPSDSTTKTNFKVLEKEGGQRGAKKWTLIYLLSSLYDNESDDFGTDFYRKVFDDDDFKLIQIDATDENAEHQNYIGNWTLLEKTLLHSAPKSAEELVPLLNKSLLKTNHSLANNIQSSGWNENDIIKRQEQFAEDSVLVW